MALSLRGVTALLEVFDMPTSIAFYRDGLGFDVVQRAGDGDDCTWVLLRLDGADLMLNTAYDEGERPPAPDPHRLAAHTDTALFFGCPDVDAAYAQLRAKGLPVEKPVTAPYGMKQLYLTDPDGFRLCFQWPAS